MSMVRFEVGLGTHSLQVTTSVPSPDRGRMHWRSALAYLVGQTPRTTPVHTMVLPLLTNAGSTPWMTGLCDALEQARVHAQSPRLGGSLEVSLGPSHAWVGVVEIPTEPSHRISASDRKDFIDAWIASHWQQDPAQGLVRIQALHSTQRYLVSWVPHLVLANLQEVCSKYGLVLTHCRPRLIDLLALWTSAPAKEGSVQVGAGIERSAQAGFDPLVELVTMDAAGPLAILRLWCPAASEAEPAQVVQPLVMRLAAQQGLSRPAHPSVHVWPHTLTEGPRT